MSILKIFIFAFVTFAVSADCASAQNKNSRNANKKIGKKVDSPIAKPGKMDKSKSPQNENSKGIKTLAAGSQSSVETPFVFVARSPETFALLQKIIENLPSEKIDFSKTAVVAAFAGEKNTGGYSVSVERIADEIAVKVAAPPKGTMVTQVLTAPFAVMLVEIERGNSLNLNLSADFTRALKKYSVTDGEFGMSGGIAGINKKFGASGTIGVMRFGEYATLAFDLTGKAGESNRKLNEIASGTVIGEKINISRLEAGNFIDGPHPPLIASGILAKEKLSLEFVSGKSDYAVSDGFTGSGKIEAAEIVNKQ